jgi:hypothetical protein
VNSEYVSELKNAGYILNPDEIVKLRIHGVPSELVRDVKRSGFNLSGDELVKLRVHGVSSEFVRGLKDSGHRPFDVDEMVKLKITE